MTFQDHLQAALGSAYSVERELGGGGMSRVFVARDSALGRRVVVKVLAPELLEGVSVDRFRREIQLAAQLQHPHIVPVLTSGDMDGVPLYTMPFVEGTSLRARIDEGGSMPVADVVRVLREVARALAYAHERGIVHRDIKPDNVLLTSGSAVVTDFGIAKALSASRAPGGTLTSVGTSIGTPTYMAPEQAAGDPAVDYRADLYSFGCVAYEMLTGSPPFTDRPPHKLLVAHMTEVPAPLRERRGDAPDSLVKVVMQCLEKDPAARPGSAAAIVQRLDAIPLGRGSIGAPVVNATRSTVLLPLALYAGAFLGVVVLTKAAIVGIGLPYWTLPGAIVAMGLGLPVVLFTAYAHRRPQGDNDSGSAPRSGSRSTLSTLAVRAQPHVTWRRTAFGGAMAIAVLVLVVSGYMTSRALGVGPGASLISDGTFGEDERILVADFRGPPSDSLLGPTVTEAFRSDLSQSENLQVMQPTAVQAVLRRMQQPRTTVVDYALAREIATREGARAVVDGEVLELGGRYIITARLHAALTGEVLANFRVTADDEAEIIPAIARLSRNLRSKIGESLRAVNNTMPLERVTTPSLEALRKYVAGMRLFSEGGDSRRAFALLEEAVTLDTAFAMAHRKIAVELGNRRLDSRRRLQAIQKAYDHRDRLSDEERYLTIASYWSTGPNPDGEKAIAALEALVEADPRNTAALNNLANEARFQRQFAKAEAFASRALAMDSAMRPHYANLAMAQMEQGKLDEAEATSRAAARNLPGSAEGPLGLARVAWARGQVDSALVLYLRLVRERAEDPVVRGLATVELAFLQVGLGRLRDAEQYFERAGAARASQGAAEAPLVLATGRAIHTALILERVPLAATILDEALARTPLASIAPLDRPHVELAAAYALVGNPRGVRAIIDDFEATRRDARDNWDAHDRAAIQAQLAMAEERYADAIPLLRIPYPYCEGCELPLLAQAQDLAGQTDSAVATLQRFVERPLALRPVLRGRYLAGSHKRLGELLETRGDFAGAARHYAAFVAMWKNADPELRPKVTEVQQRLARLRAMERR